MSIGENTLLLKRQKSCSVCSGLDFRDSLCLNCNNSHTTQQATLPISIKQCRGAAVRPASSKTTPLQSSLSSSLTVASPPPIFTFVEEAEQQQQGQASFDSRLASEDVNDGNDNGQCNNSGNAQRQQQSQQQQQPSLPLNEQLFKEYRDVTASSTAGLSSAFEFSESDDDDDSEDSDDDDGDNDCFSEDESIQWCFEDYFAGLPGNDWCVRVPTVFFQDEFNIFELPDVFHCPLRLTDFQPDFRKSKSRATAVSLFQFCFNFNPISIAMLFQFFTSNTVSIPITLQSHFNSNPVSIPFQLHFRIYGRLRF